MPRTIAVEVVEADALTLATDVLVLKHAQALYGLDERIVETAHVPLDLLPRPDGFRLIPSPRNLPAKALLFIGTVSLREFSYDEIHEFGTRTLCSLASAAPEAEDVSLTIHGPGYGLDEIACFDSTLSGLLHAIRSEDVPRRLTRIRLLEINPGRAQRLRMRLEALLPGGVVEVGVEERRRAAPEAEEIDVAPVANRRHAFVAMPFHDSFDDVFDYGITNAVHRAELLCERVDKQPFTGDVLERMKDKIRSAALVVADVTGANANVFLEIGFAWGETVPTVLVCREGSDLPFDIQGQRCLMYTSIKDLEMKLGDELVGLKAELV
jgi:hypothetical protein